jgi:hypothetical protein
MNWKVTIEELFIIKMCRDQCMPVEKVKPNLRKAYQELRYYSEEQFMNIFEGLKKRQEMREPRMVEISITIGGNGISLEITCPRCSSTVKEDWEFCHSCSQSLDMSEVAEVKSWANMK